MRPMRLVILVGFLSRAWAPASAQERAYFVTYDHYLEERGNLEIAVSSTSGFPKDGGAVYTAPWLELEYNEPSLLNQKRLTSPPRQPSALQRKASIPPRSRWYSRRSKSA